MARTYTSNFRIDLKIEKVQVTKNAKTNEVQTEAGYIKIHFDL